MKRKLIIPCSFALTLASITTAIWIQSPLEPRVVFLRGNELLTANADGSDVRILAKDSLRKADPRWSPDKGKIVYRVDGERTKDPKTHAMLNVITSDGSPLKNLPVLATETDGSIVGGMRFVEESGWHSNAAVFASGSVNPSIAEYRIIHTETGRVIESYFGTGFATCASKAQVAYTTVTREKSGGSKGQLEVNGTIVYTNSSDQDSLIRNLQWSSDCNRLAFTESNEAGGKFVVIRGESVEARIPLRVEMLDSVSITNHEESFLLQSASDAVYYDATTHSLRPNPEIAEKAKQMKMEREKVLKRLGGRSADW
jgi:hypothetical protein